MKHGLLIFIGTIKKQPNCGESMKNHIFIDRFKEIFKRVITIDIFQPRKHPFCLLKVVLVALLHRSDKIVLSVSPATGDKFIRLLLRLGCQNVYYWAVGFLLMDYFKQGLFDASMYNKLKAVYVQSPTMVKALFECGVLNVAYVPNSKRIDYMPQLKLPSGGKLRFVFLSRIHPEKGCYEIVEATRQLNDLGYRDFFTVTFYGAIAPDYEDSFRKMVSSCDNVRYNGFLNLKKPNGYDELSTYDVMLFPTYYDGEAFPGVIIDAFVAGLPVIASDWHFNKEIIDDSVGIIIQPHNVKSLVEAMMTILNENKNLPKMRKQCQEKATQFDNRNVLSEAQLSKIGFLS